MNELQLFNFEGNKLRGLLIDEAPYFVAKDATQVLGYKNTTQALNDRVDDEDKISKLVNESQISENDNFVNGSQRMVNVDLINESGLYSLILSSKMPNAKKFKHWVTSEVLPAIRKNGSYQIPQTPEEQLKLTMQVTNRLVGRVDKVEKDIKHIKDTAEVDEQERYELLQARKARVMKACGGEDSNYYQEKKAKKVFAEFGRDFKKAFQIPRYDCLKKKLFDEAIEFTKNWYPSFVLQREIQNVNAQTRLPLNQRGSAMNDLQEAIYKIVVKEVARTEPKRKENFLGKKDAEKLIEKYTRKYVFQEYLNANDAAAVLGMSLTTFWKFRQKYPVPVHVIDGTIKRYKKSELIEFVDKHSVRGCA